MARKYWKIWTGYTHLSHTWSLIFSWTCLMCTFSCTGSLKALPHRLHSKSLWFMWASLTCFFNRLERANSLSHSSHLNNFCSLGSFLGAIHSWACFLCLFKAPNLENSLSHSSQLCLMPSWTLELRKYNNFTKIICQIICRYYLRTTALPWLIALFLQQW